MTEKVLGKIDFAEFGTVKDRSFLIGLQLGFSLNGCGVFNGGQHTVNISKHCRWEAKNREATITKRIEEVYEILTQAKVNYVSELIGKPVEVTIEDNTYKDFRILTEVL